jgi:uncharacterized protein
LTRRIELPTVRRGTPKIRDASGHCGGSMGYIASWSRWTEFTVVILGAFGYFIFCNIVALFDQGIRQPVDESDIRFILVYQLIVIAILWQILRARGWTLEHIDMRPTVIRTLQGFGLLIVAHVVFVGIVMLLVNVLPQLLPPPRTSPVAAPSIGLDLLILGVVVNSIFEEVFATGYVISALMGRYSPWTAINVSVAIRLSYHLYQGAAGVIGIVPTGLIFAFWYARKGTLWPLITAHTLHNLYMFLGR